MRRLLSFALAFSLIGLSGCGRENDPDPISGEAVAQSRTTWERLPDFPLAERHGPVVAWTGTEVLVVGGSVGDECPPNASCVIGFGESATDGAAFDPVARTWRTLAGAPREIPAYNRGVVVAGQFFIRVDEDLLAYDIAKDRWSTLRRISGWYGLVADRDRLVLINGSDENGKRPDLVYEPATGAWSRLPDDPLGPSYVRDAVSTPHGLVLGAKALVPSPGGGDQPSYLEAALLDRTTGEWKAFGPSGRIGGGEFRWSAVGDRAVISELGGSDGGGEPPGDYGRKIPYGGRLDVRTGEWSDLPNPPREGSGGWVVYAVDGRLIADGGFLYDDDTGAWLRVPRPDGASANPGPAVWAGDTLTVITALGEPSWTRESRSNEVWAWTPVTVP